MTSEIGDHHSCFDRYSIARYLRAVWYHFAMMWRELSILLILMIVSSFTQAKDECPLQCDCTEDFSLVKCRDMEKFPVFGFASKVKIL